MNLSEFKETIYANSSLELAKKYLYQKTVHVFNDEAEYDKYLNIVRFDYKDSEHIAVVGSGNWKYSLNPEKMFREFSYKSDVDIAIISKNDFQSVWEELRLHHRNKYYTLSQREQIDLRRNGENVYSGFVSPKWIPELRSPSLIKYNINTDKYSFKPVGFRTVNMLFFRNHEEALDYYVRSFRIAKNWR